MTPVTSEMSYCYPSAGIFDLPDDVLMKICAFITSIGEKMKLEQVSRRFNRISSHPTSWNGVHSLALMTKCSNFHWEIDIFKSECNEENVGLNGVFVPFEKWPAAIEAFLQRTKLRNFTIHYGGDSCLLDDLYSGAAILSRLTEIFVQYQDKIQIESIEIDGSGSSGLFDFDEIQKDAIQKFKDFFSHLFQSSIPYLQEFRFFELIVFDDANIGNVLWPIIEKCDKLKSISLAGDIRFDLLIGKPLTEIALNMSIYNSNGKYGNIMVQAQQLVQVLNTASSEKFSLTLKCRNNALDFILYHDNLTENSRKKLKSFHLFRFIDPEEYISISSVFSLFPNMETFELDYNAIRKRNHVVKFLDDVRSFFDLTHDGLITRQFILHSLFIPIDLREFSVELENLSENSQIDIDFGEMQPTPFVHLTRGKSSWIIMNFTDFLKLNQ